jgi:LysR family transcriptional regulator for bpeEF and oprC
MDRLRAIEVFQRVAELGSFTAAARQLGLPRASATTHVQALESHVGATLLHRTTRRVALTPEGALFYEESARITRELDELEHGLRAASASPRGRLRVDAPAAAGRHVLAHALPGFLARYPGLVVELGASDRLVDLRAEGIDCVLRGGDVHDDTLVARKLGVLPVITCAAPRYLAERGRPVAPDRLEGHVFVNYFSSKTGRVFEVDWQRGADKVVAHPPHVAAANDAETWVALAVAGLGLLQVPCGPEVRRRVAAGELEVVLPEWESEPLPSTVLYPRTLHVPARVRVFIDWVVEVYAEETAAASAFAIGARARAQTKRTRPGHSRRSRP